jgi:hypothetical protein
MAKLPADKPMLSLEDCQALFEASRGEPVILRLPAGDAEKYRDFPINVELVARPGKQFATSRRSSRAPQCESQTFRRTPCNVELRGKLGDGLRKAA